MKKLYELVGKVETVVAATCFSLSCLMIFSAAVARTLNHPINWSQDMSLFLFAWSVFISADVGLRADRLVNVDLLVKVFPHKHQKVIALINYAIILVFLAAMVFFGIKLSIFSWRRVFQGMPGFSYGWVTLSAPVGSFLIGTTVVLKMKALLTGVPEAKSGTPGVDQGTERGIERGVG
jgi:TRAP-type C4-dicarboxylate transport system permease small subunit